ncbi:hypothetical protein [Bacteroides neonati]|uniref:hypothetical protein n=1 Tax=Bacteroides neonati TaxID=1347393 RepID=UPI0004BCAF2B|nr:hypothetical protein [Bacteroides neonati]
MIAQKIRLWSILLLLATHWACTDGKEEAVTETKVYANSLTFGMMGMRSEVIDNTQVYLFDDTDKFREKVSDITYGTDRLSMFVPTGTWNVSLVAANEPITDKLISPIRGKERSTLKMWETDASGGELPSMPELRTAFVNTQTVVAGQETVSSEEALLSRNVAMLKVVVADARELDINGIHYLRILGVPTTLNWQGRLYPSATAPTTSEVPMQGVFSLRKHETLADHQQSDTLTFIIPAHKGVDYLSPQPTDTTTQNLYITVDMALQNGSRYQVSKPAMLPRVPRVNTILLARLNITGRLNVTTQVLDWKEVPLEANLIQTVLYTDKPSIGLAYKDTLIVNTNAKDFTVTKAPDAPWITSVRKIEGNAVEVTADVNSYVDNSPRTSYILLKADNITRKVEVTQRPDRGTIKIGTGKLVLHPGIRERGTLDVTSLGGSWKFISSTPKATANVQSGGVGITPVTFTRVSTSDKTQFNTYYGDGKVVVKNTTTLDTDTLNLINAYIYIENNNVINVNAPLGSNQTAVTNSKDVMVWGGSRNLTFTSWSTWIHPGMTWDSNTQVLTLTTDRDPNDQWRRGFLEYYHADAPDYRIRSIVYQSIFESIPEFDYLSLKFSWGGSDLNVAVEFAGNNLSGLSGQNNSTYDKLPVGAGLHTSVNYNQQLLLLWAGDAKAGEGESVYFNAPVLNNDPFSLEKVKFDIYATWNTPGIAPNKMNFTMTAYKGGSMVQSGTNYNNSGGQKLYEQSYSVTITSTQGVETYATGGYTKVATVTYDRVKHTALVNLLASPY